MTSVGELEQLRHVLAALLIQIGGTATIPDDVMERAKDVEVEIYVDQVRPGTVVRIPPLSTAP